MTRPICTWTMPGRHLQLFVHSLTKLCRHTTLVQQRLSNGHQQISQCLSYTEPEDALKARAYSTPKSSWKVVRILNHLVKTTTSPPTPATTNPYSKVRRNKEGWPKILVLKTRCKGEKKMHSGKGSAFPICFLCQSNYKSFAIIEFFSKRHSQ